MKAPVLVDVRRIEFQDKPKPVIRLGEVLVKVEYCGICGSDVHGYLNGIVIPVGTVMGHEFSGVVAEVGEEVYGVRPGDRVVVKPSASCLGCYWCRRGQYRSVLSAERPSSASAQKMMAPMQNMYGSDILVKCSLNYHLV